MAEYLIDNVVVANVFNVRHTYLPGDPQVRIEKQFPGVAERFVIKGPELPPDLQVVAFLVGFGANDEAAITDLIEQMRTHNQRRAPGQTYDVTIQGFEFTECELVNFASAGNVVVLSPSGGTFRVARQVRWDWRQLA